MEFVGNDLYLTEKELAILNRYIDSCIGEMHQHRSFNWNNFRKILNIYDTQDICIPKPNKIIYPMKKQEVIGYALRYFEFLGSDFYDLVVQSVLGQKKNTIVEVYDRYGIENWNEKNEFGAKRHISSPKMAVCTGREAIVYAPLNYYVTKEEKRATGCEATLSDLYAFVHELGHRLDYIPDANFATNWTRDYFTETTAISFEMGLSEYLLQEGKISKDAIIYEYNTRVNDSFLNMEHALMILRLVERKINTMQIDNGDILQIQKETGYKTEFVEYLLDNLIRMNPEFHRLVIYGMGSTIAPTISQKLINPEQRHLVKEYIEAVKKDGKDTIFMPFGLKGDETDVDLLVANLMTQVKHINEMSRGER